MRPVLIALLCAASLSATAQSGTSITRTAALLLPTRPLLAPPLDLDALVARKEAQARRIVASICVGCGLPDEDDEAAETVVPVLPTLGDGP